MCAFCGKINSTYLCDKCKSKIEKIQNPCIQIYDKEDIYYNEHIYLFAYKGHIREKIIDYKFNNKSYYFKTFSKILLNNKKICEILKSYDIIVPVPIHTKRRKERGYNQTELIARELVREINKNTNLKLVNILIKNINTKPQSTLNKKQRIENAKNVYQLKSTKGMQKLTQKRILLFDDIYTTGSTANECAKGIKQLQPKKIGILTIAKD